MGDASVNGARPLRVWLEFIDDPESAFFGRAMEIYGDAGEARRFLGMCRKALTGFAEDHDERPALKGGVLEGSPLAREMIVALTKLPPREQLVAQLVGGLASPIQRLSAVAAPLQQLSGGMNALLGGVTRGLAAYRDQRTAAGES